MSHMMLFVTVGHAKSGGVIDGGGGVAIVCGEEGNRRVYLADVFDLMREDKLLNYESLPEEWIFQAAAHILKNQHPYWRFKRSLDSDETVDLEWMLNYINDGLDYSYNTDEALTDDHIKESNLPKGCEKKQIVIQSVKKRRYIIDLDLKIYLTNVERALLRLHEALISLRQLPGEDTTPIRELVKSSVSNQRDFNEAIEIIKNRNNEISLTVLPEKLSCDIFNNFRDDVHGPPTWQKIELATNQSSRFVLTLLGKDERKESFKNELAIVNFESKVYVNLSFDKGRMIFLNKYNSYTRRFSGSIQFPDPDSFYFRYNGFNISCH